MKKLFKAIRAGDLNEVKAIIEKKPETISCVSTPPPKKDMGQSPLQVAVKTAQFDIAYYLIEQGADFNAWASRGHFPEPHPGETNRVRYLNDIIPQVGVNYPAHTRRVIQRYCRERGL